MDIKVTQTSGIRLLNLMWCNSDVKIQVNKNGKNVRVSGGSAAHCFTSFIPE
jgi:hypothetical protein